MYISSLQPKSTSVPEEEHVDTEEGEEMSQEQEIETEEEMDAESNDDADGWLDSISLGPVTNRTGTQILSLEPCFYHFEINVMITESKNNIPGSFSTIEHIV